MSDESTTGVPDIPYQAIIEQSLAGIYVIQDEVFCYANATFAAIAGYTPAEMIGQHLRKFVQPDFIDTVLQSYHRRLAGNPASERFVSRALHKDGRMILIEIHGSRVMHRGRYAVAGVGVEVTERIRNEEELRESREQLRQLSAYTTAKLEDQRRALSRDIHDELGGMLTALKMDATRVMRRVEGEELQAMMQGLLGLTQQTIDAVKRIAEELRPSALDQLDLPLAIRHELEMFTLRSGVAHRLDAQDASTLRLSPRRATAIYRIFNEALTNVARHAGASRVDVVLSLDEERFLLELRDDGIGFDAAATMRTPRSLGLLHMQERAREIGGEVRIESTPGRGTRLVLAAPLL
ncbi:PAS domain-containing sensor histidine kinase [Pelomonas sp. KK5]|uniref:PAS domain-containing sensor histidine kinase n=1 Tax=Pelomonas sp. KK5 TaxID=1855730 RepID=UPI00097BD07A|nr:PAS domain-containing sensor histidine kinase [Pelomonas sp. KK5]